MKHSRGRTLKHLARAIADERVKRNSPIRGEQLLVKRARVKGSFPDCLPEEVVKAQMYAKMADFMRLQSVGELKKTDGEFVYSDDRQRFLTWDLEVRFVEK